MRGRRGSGLRGGGAVGEGVREWEGECGVYPTRDVGQDRSALWMMGGDKGCPPHKGCRTG